MSAEEILRQLEGKKPFVWQTPEYKLTMDVDLDYFRSALASYAAHLLSRLPERRDDSFWSERDGKRIVPIVSEAYNAALDDCRSAIMREAGIKE